MRSEVFDAFRIIFGPKRVGQQLVDGFRIAIPVGNLIQVDRSRKRLGGHRKGRGGLSPGGITGVVIV